MILVQRLALAAGIVRNWKGFELDKEGIIRVWKIIWCQLLEIVMN